MKCIRYIITVCMFLFFIGGNKHIAAQHFVGGSVAGHMPISLDKLNITHPSLSYGGEIGFVYAYQKEHFIIQTGLSYSLLCPSLRLDSQWLSQDMIDTRGMPFTYHGFLQNRRDQLFIGSLSVPLYVGGAWSGFYFLVGGRVVVNIHARSHQRAELQTVGDYQGRYYEWFENMPNHGFHDYQPTNTDKSVFLRMYDVRLGTEFGYMIHLKTGRRNRNKPNIRFGVFAECGLLAMSTSLSSKSYTQPDYTHYLSVDMTHIYDSVEGLKAAPHLLTCGARITILFSVSGKGKYKCKCLGY